MLQARNEIPADDSVEMPSRQKEGQGILAAILPGAKIGSGGKVVVSVGTTKETIVFNVGGTKFETYRSTLMRLPDLSLADDNFLKKYFRKDFGDYFFDRDPDMFKVSEFQRYCTNTIILN